jgi:hypothetical protein
MSSTVRRRPSPARNAGPALAVRARILKDFAVADMKTDPSLRYGISFTSLLYNPNDGLIYCGLTAADGDIFYTFNHKTKRFQSLNFPAVCDEFDIKIHRSLELDTDGTIYGATAGLHPVPDRLRAGGGRIFKYHPREGKIHLLARPVKYDYIQCIALDRQRKILYGFTYPVPKFFRYDILADRAYDFDYLGDCPHIPAVDDDGFAWGTYSEAHLLFKYHPDSGFTWFKHGVPKQHRWGEPFGWAAIDGMMTGDDGLIYIGTTEGSLFRLHPKTAEVEYLCKPHTSSRLTYLAIGPDKLIYGAAGASYDTTIAFRYDRRTRAAEVLGRMRDPTIDKSCFIVHHVCMTPDGTLYAAETDNPDRAGYLWELKLPP